VADSILKNLLIFFGMSLGMLWMIFWALVLGFSISGAVQAFVSKEKMASLLGKPGLKQLTTASFFGVMSSSCSYAAASMARSIFQKGAHIIPSLAFMLASTNLVIELSVVLWVMLGWQFVLAEFLGGILLILNMAVLMKLFGPLKEFQAKQKELFLKMDFTVKPQQKLSGPGTKEGWIRASQAFVMEWKMIWKDVLIGVFVSGFLMTFVPDSFWQSLFLNSGTRTDSSILKLFENALIGPIVAMMSFVCSVGNIPLAQALFHGGISFGGAVSFIYGDLIVIPLILIYRKYYGWKLALWISGIFYVSMVVSGVLIDLLFRALHLIPVSPHSPEMAAEHMTSDFFQAFRFFKMNYTFWLNLIFLGIAIALTCIARSSKDNKVEEADCCHS
jgi:uncharacterized membrane protein YraQ (UPF0718 family)